MGRLLIVNGSPRAPRSNSKRYGELFARCFSGDTDTYLITEKEHLRVFEELNRYQDMLLVFPLYADGIPAVLLRFLQELEAFSPAQKPVIHVLMNCGFLEPDQNQTACDMVKMFCAQNGYRFGSCLLIGSGEAILTTPFAFLARRGIKKLAASIARGRPGIFKTTMPISKEMFVKASTQFWIRYGEKNKIGKQQMETMKIEGEGTEIEECFRQTD